MIYITTAMTILAGTLAVTNSKQQSILHYLGTNANKNYETGKLATEISCTIIVKTDSARATVEALMADPTTKGNLIFSTRYYKDVVPSGAINARLKTPDELVWYLDVKFTALIPVPYSVATDEELY